MELEVDLNVRVVKEGGYIRIYSNEQQVFEGTYSDACATCLGTMYVLGPKNVRMLNKEMKKKLKDPNPIEEERV